MYADHDGRLRPNVPEGPPGYDKPGWNAVYPQVEFARRYAGEVSHFDASVGRLLDALEAEELADDTVVVLTSDHGELAGSHGRFGKEVMLEYGMPEEAQRGLEALGHEISFADGTGFGGSQVILVDPATGTYFGASDPRKDGAALGY